MVAAGRLIVVVRRLMACDSPQFLLDGGVVDCGLCFTCSKVKSDAERQRRYYWLKKRRLGHV